MVDTNVTDFKDIYSLTKELRSAVEKDELQAAQNLINLNADIVNADNATPSLLHLAILNANNAMVNLLLANGAKIVNDGNTNTVDLAVDIGDINILRSLAEYGADFSNAKESNALLSEEYDAESIDACTEFVQAYKDYFMQQDPTCDFISLSDIQSVLDGFSVKELVRIRNLIYLSMTKELTREEVIKTLRGDDIVSELQKIKRNGKNADATNITNENMHYVLHEPKQNQKPSPWEMLITAIDTNNLFIVKLILSQYLDIDLSKPVEKGYRDPKPLILEYVLSRHKNPEIIIALLEHGATVPYFSSDQEPFISYVYNSLYYRGTDVDTITKILRLMIAQGADINTRLRNGATILSDAINTRRPLSHIKMLLDLGVDPFINECLKYAISSQRTDIVDLLLERYPNSRLHKPFLSPILDQNIEMIKKLLQHGIKVSLEEFESAFFGRNINIIKLFAENDSTLLHKGKLLLRHDIEQGNITFVQQCLNLGFDINERNNDGNTIAHSAVYARRMTMLENAVKNFHASVTIRNANGYAPLHLAVAERWLPGIQFLLTVTDPDIRNRDGQTPLQMAVHHKLDHDIVRTLVDAGANVNVCDNENIFIIDENMDSVTREILMSHIKKSKQNVKTVSKKTATVKKAKPVAVKKAAKTTSGTSKKSATKTKRNPFMIQMINPKKK